MHFGLQFLGDQRIESDRLKSDETKNEVEQPSTKNPDDGTGNSPDDSKLSREKRESWGESITHPFPSLLP